MEGAWCEDCPPPTPPPNGPAMKSILCALGIAAAVVACSHDNPGPVTGRAFDDVFQETEVVRLVENARDPIIDVPRLTFARDGRIAFADLRAYRVRVFARTGQPIGVVGRMGAGPGEFENLRGRRVRLGRRARDRRPGWQNHEVLP